MDAETSKRRAALAALDHLPPAGVIGLGTGSTTRYFIEGLAERVRAGHAYVGIATSHQSQALATRLGIPLLGEAGPWDVLVCVDGADEVSAELDLIKGGGGAHTREKLVNSASAKNIIVVDDGKCSKRLGERRAVPIEVLQFGHLLTQRRLAAFGEPALREVEGQPFITDSGNLIYDLRTGPIDAPSAFDQTLRAIPGVVETGLFCGRADVVIVAGANGIEQRNR